MATQRSPLAPADFPVLPPVPGARLAAAACGVRYRGRADVCLIELAPGTQASERAQAALSRLQ